MGSEWELWIKLISDYRWFAVSLDNGPCTSMWIKFLH
jgi:hypothetical protein